MDNNQNNNGKSEGFNPYKKEFPRKTIIKWEGDLIDFLDIKRTELIEEYDQVQDRPKYGIKFMFQGYPFDKTYWYPSEDYRDERMRFLEGKLGQARVLFL